MIADARGICGSFVFCEVSFGVFLRFLSSRCFIQYLLVDQTVTGPLNLHICFRLKFQPSQEDTFVSVFFEPDFLKHHFEKLIKKPVK